MFHHLPGGKFLIAILNTHEYTQFYIRKLFQSHVPNGCAITYKQVQYRHTNILNFIFINMFIFIFPHFHVCTHTRNLNLVLLFSILPPTQQDPTFAASLQKGCCTASDPLAALATLATLGALELLEVYALLELDDFLASEKFDSSLSLHFHA